MTHDATKCRFCETPLKYVFADLGMSPLANSYLNKEQLNQMEPYYPLSVYVCDKCYLVQLPEFESPEGIFSDYAYFSSFSDSWLQHAREYTHLMVKRFQFDSQSQIIEIASNDGYLLQYFKEKGIPVLGIEPAGNVAEVAIEKGMPSHIKFFGTETAKELLSDNIQADLLLGNNVLAHVPNLNDFVKGLKIALKPDGVITMEFPHLMRLMDENQFDTIYHEHFSYFSFTTVRDVFKAHGLTLFDVDELKTHGGSLRIYARHTEDKSKDIQKSVKDLINQEIGRGFTEINHYMSFGEHVKETKRKVLDFLIKIKREGKSISGYGAPAKGNTLLNYCGIRTDFIDYTVDRSPHKQNQYLPGVHIPINGPEMIQQTKPDYLVILPWNIKDEIMDQMSHIREWG
jgi:SAM-dependent methyltransferase